MTSSVNQTQKDTSLASSLQPFVKLSLNNQLSAQLIPFTRLSKSYKALGWLWRLFLPASLKRALNHFVLYTPVEEAIKNGKLDILTDAAAQVYRAFRSSVWFWHKWLFSFLRIFENSFSFRILADFEKKRVLPSASDGLILKTALSHTERFAKLSLNEADGGKLKITVKAKLAPKLRRLIQNNDKRLSRTIKEKVINGFLNSGLGTVSITGPHPTRPPTNASEEMAKFLLFHKTAGNSMQKRDWVLLASLDELGLLDPFCEGKKIVDTIFAPSSSKLLSFIYEVLVKTDCLNKKNLDRVIALKKAIDCLDPINLYKAKLSALGPDGIETLLKGLEALSSNSISGKGCRDYFEGILCALYACKTQTPIATPSLDLSLGEPLGFQLPGERAFMFKKKYQSPAAFSRSEEIKALLLKSAQEIWLGLEDDLHLSSNPLFTQTPHRFSMGPSTTQAFFPKTGSPRIPKPSAIPPFPTSSLPSPNASDSLSSVD